MHAAIAMCNHGDVSGYTLQQKKLLKYTKMLLIFCQLRV